MNIRFPLLVGCTCVFFMSAIYSNANSRTLGFINRRADVVENKRVQKQMWAQPQQNSMMDKSFPLEKWDKHFSSVGSKRSAISVSENKDKKMFATKTYERKEVSFDMSRWNDRMADLHKKAGIDMDERAQLVADTQLYYMMMQDSERFRDMADEVSLRDLNRYQFRRNHSDGEVPVEKAGGK